MSGTQSSHSQATSHGHLQRVAAENLLLPRCRFPAGPRSAKLIGLELSNKIKCSTRKNANSETCAREICCLFLADAATEKISTQPQVDDAALFPAAAQAYHRRQSAALAEKEPSDAFAQCLVHRRLGR